MSSPRTYNYSRSHRLLEIVSIALFFCVLAGIGWNIGRATTDLVGALAVVLAAVASYLLADVLSGIVHWAGDTVGDESWPIFGKNFIHHFRYHHVDPKDITRHDFIETNGNNCIVCLPPVILAWWLAPAREGFALFGTAMVGFTALFIFATNQFHKWAHAGEDAPWLARVLQRWNVILPPRHHDIHHAVPHDKYYCITVGWMNPVLQKLHFFRALEWLIARVRPDILHLEERSLAPGAR